MAKFGSDSAYLLVGGYDLTGVSLAMRDGGVESVLEESHGFGTQYQAFTAVGLRKAMFGFDAFYDDATGQTVDALVGGAGAGGARQIVDRIAAWGVEGLTVGKRCNLETGGFTAKVGRIPVRGELVKISADINVSAQPGYEARENGLVLETLATRSAALTGAAVDNTAGTSNGISGHLHVPTLVLGGYTNVIFKIQHSVDNSAWTDLVTFTAVTAAAAKERIFVAGAVNRYLRATAAWTGAGAGNSFRAFIGAARF